jgi:hypothetical protein
MEADGFPIRGRTHMLVLQEKGDGPDLAPKRRLIRLIARTWTGFVSFQLNAGLHFRRSMSVIGGKADMMWT